MILAILTKAEQGPQFEVTTRFDATLGLGAFERAQQEGALSPNQDAADLADAMLAMIQGIHMLGRTFNSPARVRRMVNAAFAILAQQ